MARENEETRILKALIRDLQEKIREIEKELWRINSKLGKLEK